MKPPSDADSIRRAFEESGDAAAVLRDRSGFVDALVLRAWQEHLAAPFPEGLALVAVGGYGRRELFPYSDIDLLLLTEKLPDSDAQRGAIAVFLRTLWDAGLRLSQSVHTIADCCSLDGHNVELTISLLDQRLLTGDAVLHSKLAARLPRFLEGQRAPLVRHLLLLTEARQGRFQGTIYHLEPNVKEGPGGLRDLHVVRWLERLRATEQEANEDLEAACRFLTDVRCRLHYRYRRDANVLAFEAQQDMAADPARWMRDYYRHARTVHRQLLRQREACDPLTESMLLRQFRDWRSRLSTPEFTVSRDRVYLRTPAQLAADPELALRLFVFVARHGTALSLETLRRLHEHLPRIASYFAERRPVWPLLRELLSLPHPALALREAHQAGVLTAVFPEWLGIECLVVRDFYHRYTVDEHTLTAIEAITELRGNNDPLRARFASLLSETDDVPLILAAFLFHDTGKSGGLEAHEERSRELAERALDRIGTPADAKRRVLLFIERHLVLSAAMLSRDLSDPATARDIAARVETIENLKALTLITYADIAAVNPAALTPWRAEQLWRAYLAAYNELTRELETDRVHAPGSESRFLEGLPVRYLRTHTPEQIAAHEELEELSRAAGAGIGLQRQNGFYELAVVTADRPALLASIAGALAAFGMEITKAEAFSNAAGTAVDTFAFHDPMRTLELNPAETDRLKHTLARVIQGKEDVRRLLKGRPKPAPRPARTAPMVAFNNEASDAATLVEIVAEDRPGLLYDLASTFSDAGCDISVVLIDTEAHRAIDVFYVTSGGGKLDADRAADVRDRLLTVCA